MGKIDTSAERLSTDKENEAQLSEGYLSAYDGGESFQLPAKVEKLGTNSSPVTINHRWHMEEQQPTFL